MRGSVYGRGVFLRLALIDPLLTSNAPSVHMLSIARAKHSKLMTLTGSKNAMLVKYCLMSVYGKCCCSNYRHNCPTHRYSIQQQHLASTKREPNEQIATSSSTIIKAKRTRTIGPIPYEQLLEEDLSRAKRMRDEDAEWFHEPCIILGKPRIKSIKVSSLGPALKKRFIHPGGA